MGEPFGFHDGLKAAILAVVQQEPRAPGVFLGPWSRFKSVLLEEGETLIQCLAYIDLNAVRAGIVQRHEDYRWCSLGYH